MKEAQKIDLAGSALLKKLISDVATDEHTKEARLWNTSTENMKKMLWSLAGLNTHENATKFKRDWLKLPNDIKACIRAAIQELFDFLKQGELCLID